MSSYLKIIQISPDPIYNHVSIFRSKRTQPSLIILWMHVRKTRFLLLSLHSNAVPPRLYSSKETLACTHTRCSITELLRRSGIRGHLKTFPKPLCSSWGSFRDEVAVFDWLVPDAKCSCLLWWLPSRLVNRVVPFPSYHAGSQGVVE